MSIFGNKVTDDDLWEIKDHIVDLEKQVESLKKEVGAINCKEDERYFGVPYDLPGEDEFFPMCAGQLVYTKNEFGRYEEWIYLRKNYRTGSNPFIIELSYAVIKPSDDKVTFVPNIYIKKGESK